MPGHTFSNLQRYADAAWQQEASARVDHAYMIASRVLPDQIHNFAHNNDWLVKNLGYVGRVHDGVDLAKNMIELPRLGSKSGQSYKLGRERLIETLRSFEMWDELTPDREYDVLAPFADPAEEAGRVRALGVAWFSKSDAARGQERLESLKAMLVRAREERVKAADDAEARLRKEKKSEEEIAKAMADALRGFAGRIDAITAGIAEVRLTRALAAGDLDAARAQVELAKGMSAVRQSQIQLALGDKEKAEKLAQDAAKADDKQVLPLATLAEVLWKIGKKDDALATFKKLLPLSAQTRSRPARSFARLAPLAQELKTAVGLARASDRFTGHRRAAGSRETRPVSLASIRRPGLEPVRSARCAGVPRWIQGQAGPDRLLSRQRLRGLHGATQYIRAESEGVRRCGSAGRSL